MANEAMDPRVAIQQFLPAAEALAPEQVKPFRLDLPLANANIQIAMPMLAQHAATIPKDLPNIQLADLQSLSMLGVAATYAALEAERVAPTEVTVSARLSEAAQHRSFLLKTLEVLVIAGLIPKSEYDPIAPGSGSRDIAEDCVSLASVFTKYKDRITNKHPVTPEQIERCALLGGWLVQNLRTTDTKTSNLAPPPPPPEVALRDRLATLLELRYEDLRKVAFYYHGRKASQYVPPLQSRRHRKPNDDSSKRGQS